ncbi:hypothetical protein PQ796_30720 (plasmid) [Priestia megaterium]|uniref:hypothetical protein n=1 Tax=Priestia TaxID=2800373 RepID=UPI00244CB727|nr:MULTISPECIES: hypothetical protein [Priestia]MDH2364087.1 hypothetical protein [Priestia megaterium]MDH2454852.1 hypothetical protein [Priestia megaterium]MDL5154308.1 hypothetical protein [Priestia megaterium]MDP9725933.1 hypothetical protein [Priestia aryabhattai]MED3872823.1 hypothetical protein [Priestia megaterium]
MKKAHILLVGSCLCSIIFGSVNTYAYTPEKLPTSQSSDHWKVKIDKPDTNNLKDNDEFNTYSIDVRNLGGQVYDATVEIYRDEPNTNTKAELITYKIPDSQNFFHHQNQPISVDSKKIEVVVTWKEEPFRVMKDGKKYPARKFKQAFLFPKN